MEYLRFLADMIAEFGAESVALITTNHDEILETLFYDAKVAVDDGFEELSTGIRVWRSVRPNTEGRGAKLLKIHGSVGWFRYTSSATSPFESEIVSGGGPEVIQHPVYGEMHLNPPARPEILLGTYNKREKYTQGLYASLYCQSRWCFLATRILLVCGYGFGDRGINQLIWDWVYTQAGPKCRIIHVHPRHDQLLRSVGVGVARLLNELHKRGILVRVERKVENLSWQDISQDLLNVEV